MAVEEKEGGKEEPKKKSKKLLFIIIGVVILLAGGVGAFFAMSGSSAGDGEEGDEEEEFESGSSYGDVPGAIMPLETFIVNLQVKGSFLKTTINLQFDEPELPPNATLEMPKLRDAVIKVLSRKSHQDILAPEGKEKVKEEIRMAVNQTLNTESVVGVYFTEFIVQ